jgi:hypothetical protein
MTWDIRTRRASSAEWAHMQVQPNGLPSTNEDLEATEQIDGSLLILYLSGQVQRVVIDHQESA